MPVTVRVAVEDDAPVVTEIVSEGLPEPLSVELVRERHRSSDGVSSVRLVATDAGGRVVGYGHALRGDWTEPGLFWVHIAVAPDVRRQGIGRALFETLREWAGARDAKAFRGDASDITPASYAFATSCGFQVERHMFESMLDLSTFDETPFTPALDRARAAGIRFLTLADVGDTEQARRALWELERTVGGDIPGGSEAAIIPFETFVEQVCDALGYDPALQFIAADGETWVGVARGAPLEASTGLYNGITGVLPAWRNHHIALALKLLLIRAAIQRGVPYIRTNNDSENAPMLAINRKLGYQPEPGGAKVRMELVADKQ